MGVFDKFLSAMSLNPEEDDDETFNDDGFLEEDEEPAAKKANQRKKRKNSDSGDDAFNSKKSTKRSKITRIYSQNLEEAGMEICVIKPKSVDDSREITDTLLSNRPVLLNVEGLDVDDAQRIIDFVAGSCYAIDGNLQKITNYIIIISPPFVDISGDILDDLMDSNAFRTPGLHTEH